VFDVTRQPRAVGEAAGHEPLPRFTTQPAVALDAVKSRYATSSFVGCNLLTAPTTTRTKSRRAPLGQAIDD
jgi:hypothetical protein